MVKVTKRPKRVDVSWKEIFQNISIHTCPSCGTEFQGFVRENTVRFKCKCGQVLIVEDKE